MKALSIRQPWAWLIVRPDITDLAERQLLAERDIIKTLENRTWPTRVRGQFLIHASAGMTRNEYEETADFAAGLGIVLPPKEKLERGGFVGITELVDCVSDSESQWFFGRFGFVLRDTKPLLYVPFKGKLGFFDVPDDILPMKRT